MVLVYILFQQALALNVVVIVLPHCPGATDTIHLSLAIASENENEN